MKISRMYQQAVTGVWPRVSRSVWPVLLAFLFLALPPQQTSAQRNASTGENRQGSPEMAKLTLEREEVRTARYKLLQEESNFHTQYLKPLDRIRRQLDAQETDLYTECSGEKDFRDPQYSHCLQDLGRFNDDVRYFNDRLDDLKAKLALQRKQFKEKSDDLDRKEREIDRKIKVLQDKTQR